MIKLNVNIQQDGEEGSEEGTRIRWKQDDGEKIEAERRKNKGGNAGERKSNNRWNKKGDSGGGEPD